MTTQEPGASGRADKAGRSSTDNRCTTIKLFAGFMLVVASSVVMAQQQVVVPLVVPRVVLSDSGPLPSEQIVEGDHNRIASSLTQSSGEVAPATASIDSGYNIDTSQRAHVQLFYRTVYSSSQSVASGWSGNTATCNAGDTTVEHKAAVLRRINWFRAMAGVPASVTFNARYNQKAQQAALLMAANLQISHFPATNLLCYNAAASEASSKSNLALGTLGPDSVSEYIEDSDSNNAEVGHRRWLLYPQTQVMGTGDVDGAAKANALWVMDGNFGAARPAVRDDFVAWPPRGYVPYQTVYPRWSFSYPQADFSNATLTMTQNGVPIATRKETLANGYGENTLVWFPGSYSDGDDWQKPVADTVYQVSLNNIVVKGVVRNFSYTVTVFDPDQAVGIPLISGSASILLQKSASYSMTSLPGANSYQWRGLLTEPLVFSDDAEAGAVNFTPATSAGYNFVTPDLAASGVLSFHLAHPTLVNQTLELKIALLADVSSMLNFNSRLGFASSDQIARVEVSLDDGITWNIVAQQAGTNHAETTFTNKAISLAAFSGRVIRLRFNYSIDCSKGCGGYNQTTVGTGWYIDDIQLTGVEKLTVSTQLANASGTNFSVTSPVTGQIWLHARAGMYGHYGEWGPVKAVSVGTAYSGILSGTISGDPANPNVISNAQITSGAFLEHVIIGAAVTFESGVRLGKNVHFMTNTSIPAGIDLSALFAEVPGISNSPFTPHRLNLASDVLVGDTQTVIDAIEQLPEYKAAGIPIQQDTTGDIVITLPDSTSLVLPAKVMQNSSNQAPGTYLNDDGDLVFVTTSGRAVIAYPLVVDRSFFMSKLAAQGLSLSIVARAGLKVARPNNSTYYMARPTSAVRASSGITEGLLTRPLVTPANVPGYTIVFKDQSDVLMEQQLVPVPTDWPLLKQTLAGIPGMTNVRIDGEGVISVVFNNHAIRARTGYVVTAGAPIISNVVSLVNAGDLNKDGTNDFLLTYPNGDRQSLYIYP